MNARLRMYEYCYSNLGAIYAKGLYSAARRISNSFLGVWRCSQIRSFVFKILPLVDRQKIF